MIRKRRVVKVSIQVASRRHRIDSDPVVGVTNRSLTRRNQRGDNAHRWHGRNKELDVGVAEGPVVVDSPQLVIIWNYFSKAGEDVGVDPDLVEVQAEIVGRVVEVNR